MQTELVKRYRFHRVFAIPSRPTNSAKFRANLAELVFGAWDVSTEDPSSCSTDRLHLHLLFQHFNGDLRSEDCWEHWCIGPHCCEDADASLRKAREGLISNCQLCQLLVFGGSSGVNPPFVVIVQHPHRNLIYPGVNPMAYVICRLGYSDGFMKSSDATFYFYSSRNIKIFFQHVQYMIYVE